MNSPQNIADVIIYETKKRGTTVNKMLLECGLNKSVIDNLKRGRAAAMDTIAAIAQYFSVTTDYLLGLNDDPNPPELVIPDVLKDVRVAFHRGAFEDLTQDEVDRLAEFATFIKSQRK